MNLYSLTRRFPTEKAALDHLVRTRWPKGVRCVACDHDKCWTIESTNKTGGPRRLFQCASCKFQFSATTGTLFHDSHLPLTKWFAAISLMSDAKKGISASQLGRHIGMTYKTAWYVAHRIREAMREAKDIQLGDPDTTVEIDEAYLGGRLRHKGSKVAKASKTMVIGLAERNGRVHLESMSNRRFESIKPVLDAKLAEDTKEVVTDGNPTYKRLIPGEKHARGNHGKELAERVWTTTQTVENAFSLFKRAIVGNYHKLSPWHLDRYMREFCWRYNRRRMQASIFEMGAGQYGQSNSVTVQETGRVLNPTLATAQLFSGAAALPPRRDLCTDLRPR